MAAKKTNKQTKKSTTKAKAKTATKPKASKAAPKKRKAKAAPEEKETKVKKNKKKNNKKNNKKEDKRRRGEDHPRAKLTDAMIEKIRRKLAKGRKQSVLARKYDISYGYMNRIAHGYVRPAK